MKQSYPALLPAGFHDLDPVAAEKLCCDGFDPAKRRKNLWRGLMRYLSELRRFGGEFEVWIDGSYTTDKPEPEDVDLVVFYDAVWANGLSLSRRMAFKTFAENINVNRVRYSCDVRFCSKGDANMRSYWRGWYAFDRDETPKGVLRITLPSFLSAPVEKTPRALHSNGS